MFHRPTFSIVVSVLGKCSEPNNRYGQRNRDKAKQGQSSIGTTGEKRTKKKLAYEKLARCSISLRKQCEAVGVREVRAKAKLAQIFEFRQVVN
jgi:hypothetical protein